MRVERVVLEHHRDVAILRRQIIDDLPANADLAGGNFLKAGDHAQGRALAAAGRPHQHDEFVVGDIKVNRAYSFDIAEFLDDLTQRDFGHNVQPLVAPEVNPAM
jgi:hypothetical protein